MYLIIIMRSDDRQFRIVGDVPAERRRQQITLYVLMLDCGGAFLADDIEAVGETTFFVDRAAEIGMQIARAGIVPAGDTIERGVGWALVNIIEKAADIRRSIKEAGQSCVNFDALLVLELKGRGLQTHAVLGLAGGIGDREATKDEVWGVAASRGRERLQHGIDFVEVIELGGLQIFDQRRWNHIDGIRRVQQWRPSERTEVADRFRLV